MIRRVKSTTYVAIVRWTIPLRLRVGLRAWLRVSVSSSDEVTERIVSLFSSPVLIDHVVSWELRSADRTSVMFVKPSENALFVKQMLARQLED